MLLSGPTWTEVRDTYGSTMPFGFGALYSAAFMDKTPRSPMDYFKLYIPQTRNQQIAALTWALPAGASAITPGALSLGVVPAAGAVTGAAVVTWLDLIGDAVAGYASNLFSPASQHQRL